MTSPMIDYTSSRPLHAAWLASEKGRSERTERSEPAPSGTDAPHTERPASSLQEMSRQRLPATPGAQQAFIALKHKAALPPLEPDVLEAVIAKEAMLRDRQLRDALVTLNAPDSHVPEEDAFRSLLSTFEDPPPPLREFSARLLQEQRADDEGHPSDGSEGAGAAGPQSSSSDFLDDIFALMERLDKEWLSRFSDILGNYVTFFNKLTDALALLSGSITSTDKDGNFWVDFRSVQRALRALKAEVENGLGLGGDFKTRAEAEAFLADLGLQDLKVRQKADGTFELVVDTALIDQLMEKIRRPPGEISIWVGPMSPAAHAAMTSAKDSLMERFNHINRVLPDKYQRQLQMWDTLVKTLSGTIDSMADTNKLIMQNMA